MNRFAFLAVCLVAALFLFACGSDDENQRRGATKADSAATPPSANATLPEARAPAPAPLPPLSAEERTQADKLVEFSNAATSALTEGYYALPDALLDNAREYLQEWRLAPRPHARTAQRDAAARRLTPAGGLFPAEAEAQLAQSVKDMSKALDSMLAEYRALEKYVADDTIRDDGAQGKKLVQNLRNAHAVFLAARKSFLETVEARAAQAENLLLREHPLKRQIVEARKIFSLFRQAGDLLAPEEPDGTALEQLRGHLEDSLALAGRPPFPAAPQVERAYRAFLKEAALFSQKLAQGQREGFHSRIRRELNESVARSREAYNAFVRAANET